ncbi:hypothetical protein JDS99_28445 [Bacillus cereus group sp. N6]|uniref:hypothetical protein n=1 Tax=Bacillus cereus group sp. N6 TaxID=2794583 RepID=UPI0018F312CD|nr:hypothetical protein [Bacillus cereus group sp. N6]MBJ8113483.1 hypothetical protein [Bacillus cereus group sp. N6]
MLVKEVYDKLKEIGLNNVVMELNVSDKGFRTGLKQVGIAYDNSEKEYKIMDNDAYSSNADESIFSFVSPKGTRKNKAETEQPKKKSPEIKNGPSDKSDKKTDNEFTDTEINQIKSLLKVAIEKQEQEKSIFELAMNVDYKGDKLRKTAFLNKDVGEKLEEVSKKTRLDKSTIVEVSLKILFDKFDL